MADCHADQRRFVVLKHEPGPGSQRPLHWDFLLEVEDSLRTWALASEPQRGPSIPAEALEPHRLAYLELEGEVSGGRGVVSRWDHGTYRTVSEAADHLIVELAGQRLRGAATLARQSVPADQWTFRFSSGRVATSG